VTAGRPRVAVVGAGIVGAAIAHRLAVRGARVWLLDRAEPGAGVTRDSFGWVGIAGAGPSEPEDRIRLRQEAIGHWTRLNAELDGALLDRPAGSILWYRTEQEVVEAADLARRFGARVTCLSRARFQALEPRVAQAPACAVHSADDLAIAPARAVQRLVRAATDLGAERVPAGEVRAVIAAGDVVAGVRTAANDLLRADFTVLAAGTATAGLAAPFLADLPLAPSPAVLLGFPARGRLVRHILSGPELEVRQPSSDTLLVAADCPEPPDRAAMAALAEAVRAAILRTFGLSEMAAPHFVRIGHRPMQGGSLPLVGPVAGIRGLLLAAGHPGVMLAPAIGHAIAGYILDGRQVPPLRALP